MPGADVLVIGASGILAPLAAVLAGSGRTVLGVSRRATGASVPGVVAMAADTTTTDGARQVAGAGPFESAVVYAPAVSRYTLPQLVGAVVGRAVIVLTSAAADPALAADAAEVAARRRPRPGDGVLLLGWASGPRWHTPAEVSAGALGTLEGRTDHVLGSVRPWRDRP